MLIRALNSIGQGLLYSRLLSAASAMLVLAATVVVLLLTGCASPSYVVLLPNPDGSTGKVTVKGTKGEQTIATPGQGAPLDGSAPATPVAEEKIKTDFGAAMAARPKLPVRYLLYFDSGAALTGESQIIIPKIIAEAADRPAVDVSVIGHTDTADSASANEELGLNRAQTTAQLLKEKGLKYHALTIESHGERNLLVPTPDNTVEPRNRRVEISIR